MNLNFDFDLEDLSFDNIGSWPIAIKIASCALIFVVIMLLGYWFHVSNQLLELERARHHEVQLRKEFESKQRKASSLQAYKLQLIKIRQTFGNLLRQLPSKTEVPGLLEDITLIGVSSGLEFKLFDPADEIRHDFYAELPIKVSVLGEYHQLAHFVSRVAGMSRIVTLHDLTLENIKADAKDKDSLLKNHRLRMDMTAKTYRYVDFVPKKEPKKNAK